MADAEQMKKIVPLITCEILFCQYICKLVFGVDILDLNLGVQINSVKQPIKSHSVGSRHMSHRRSSAFDDQFHHDFVILKDVQHRTKSRKHRFRRDVVNIAQVKNCRAGLDPWFGFECLFDMVLRDEFPRT